jgi:hypothetical protein
MSSLLNLNKILENKISNLPLRLFGNPEVASSNVGNLVIDARHVKVGMCLDSCSFVCVLSCASN